MTDMTLADLYCTLLVAGFCKEEHDIEKDNISCISIRSQIVRVQIDPSYLGLWRYADVHPFDIGAVIRKDGGVLIVYDGEVVNDSTWNHYYNAGNPREAWEFIRKFLEEHPQ